MKNSERLFDAGGSVWFGSVARGSRTSPDRSGVLGLSTLPKLVLSVHILVVLNVSPVWMPLTPDGPTARRPDGETILPHGPAVTADAAFEQVSNTSSYTALPQALDLVKCRQLYKPDWTVGQRRSLRVWFMAMHPVSPQFDEPPPVVPLRIVSVIPQALRQSPTIGARQGIQLRSSSRDM